MFGTLNNMKALKNYPVIVIARNEMTKQSRIWFVKSVLNLLHFVRKDSNYNISEVSIMIFILDFIKIQMPNNIKADGLKTGLSNNMLAY